MRTHGEIGPVRWNEYVERTLAARAGQKKNYIGDPSFDVIIHDQCMYNTIPLLSTGLGITILRIICSGLHSSATLDNSRLEDGRQ